MVVGHRPIEHNACTGECKENPPEKRTASKLAKHERPARKCEGEGANRPVANRLEEQIDQCEREREIDRTDLGDRYR